MNHKICGFLREKRMEQNLSIRELAQLSGLSPSSISRIENGERFPSVSTLKKLSIPLNTEYVLLLKEADMLNGADPNIVDLDKILNERIVLYKGKRLTKETINKLINFLK